jgi:hypothetical protein
MNRRNAAAALLCPAATRVWLIRRAPLWMALAGQLLTGKPVGP